MIFTLNGFSMDYARFNGDNGNTGQFNDTILKPPLKLKWRYFTNGGFKASPIVFRGRVFCCDRTGQIYALNADDGSLLWKKYYLTAQGDNAIPLAYNNYLYFFGNGYANFYCVRQDNGEEVWHHADIGTNSIYRGKYSAVAYDGKVYTAHKGSGNIFRVSCFDCAAGKLIWKKEYGGGSDLINNGAVLICTTTTPPSVVGNYSAGKLNWLPKEGATFCLTADSGHTLWENRTYFAKRPTLYDTLVYSSACSSSYIEGAINVRNGQAINSGTLGTYDNEPAATDANYLFSKPYCGEPFFANRHTMKVIGDCDWSLISSTPKWGTGCGGISLANGFGYFGMGSGGGGLPAAGGYGRGGLGQGIFAFEIPKDTATKILKVVWWFKTASNICSTPVIDAGKLYLTTNQEGAVYCFENDL
jgi:outer membrane protein assembly factor BamB